MEIAPSIGRRVRSATGIEGALAEQGWARWEALLGGSECDALQALFERDDRFRSTIDMQRHRFGAGRYRYFGEPLPRLVRELRSALYARLVPVANEWARRLGDATRFPPTLAAFRSVCAAAGQARPTPLLLRYGPGDFNRLHQDVYGAIAFPLQVVIPLSPSDGYAGGELVLHEQPPRAQARVTVLRPEAGDGIVFANRFRPLAGARGFLRVPVRHGLSTVTAGARTALGIIFHDAA